MYNRVIYLELAWLEAGYVDEKWSKLIAIDINDVWTSVWCDGGWGWGGGWWPAAELGLTNEFSPAVSLINVRKAEVAAVLATYSVHMDSHSFALLNLYANLLRGQNSVALCETAEIFGLVLNISSNHCAVWCFCSFSQMVSVLPK